MLKGPSGFRFHNLLVWLLLYMLAGPFLQHVPHANIIASLSMTLVLLFAAYATEPKTRLFKWMLGVMTVAIVLLWLEVFRLVRYPRIVNTVAIMIFVGMLIYSFTIHVYTTKKVDSSLISSALCLYLFLGVFWGFLYEFVEILCPNSFAGDLLTNAATLMEKRQYYQYFSFVTLTTLGYGDILPQSPGASALCHTEAVVGQIFMTVLVARLVSIQVAQNFSSEASRSGDESKPNRRPSQGIRS